MSLQKTANKIEFWSTPFFCAIAILAIIIIWIFPEVLPEEMQKKGERTPSSDVQVEIHDADAMMRRAVTPATIRKKDNYMGTQLFVTPIPFPKS